MTDRPTDEQLAGMRDHGVAWCSEGVFRVLLEELIERRRLGNLSEVEAYMRADGIPDGPWRVLYNTDDEGRYPEAIIDAEGGTVVVLTGTIFKVSDELAEFLAATRTTLPLLVERVKTAETALNEAKDELFRIDMLLSRRDALDPFEGRLAKITFAMQTAKRAAGLQRQVERLQSRVNEMEKKEAGS